MSDSLIFDMQGDPKGAEAAFKRVQKELEKTKQAFAEMAKESANSAKQAESHGTSFVAGLGKAAVSAGILTAAIKAASAEYGHLIDKQKAAAAAMMNVADSRMALNLQLGDTSQERRAMFHNQAEEISRRTGVDLAKVNQGIAAATASQGNLTDQQLLRNVEMTYKVARHDDNEMREIAGGLGDMVKLTGNADATVNMGAMLEFGNQARVKNTAFVAQNMVPGAIGAMGFGGTASESIGFTSTMSHLLNDQQGAETKTAVIIGAAQMDKVLGEQYSPVEHIRRMQDNPALLKKFLDKASLPDNLKVAYRKLATKGSAEDKLFTQNLAGLGTDAELAESANRYLKDTGQDPLIAVADQHRQMLAASTLMKTRDPKQAQAGVNQLNLYDLMRDSDAGYFETKGQQLLYGIQTLGGVPANDAMVERLRDRAQTIRGHDGDSARERAADPVKESRAKELDRLATMLQQNTAAMEANTRAMNAVRKNIDAHTE